VTFDADTSHLDVVPDAPAYGTKLRWSAPKLIAAAHQRVTGVNVRTLHVLLPAPRKTGPAPAARSADHWSRTARGPTERRPYRGRWVHVRRKPQL
jgi:hypothetical protein